MRIGYGWTKITEGENKKQYISISLNDVIGLVIPWLKNCFITLWHIPKAERKTENSPDWSIELTRKKEKKENNEQPITDDEIPW